MALNTSAALKQRLGWFAYTDPIARSVLGNKQFATHYTIDGARGRSVRAHTIIVGNCGTLTAGILLLPDAVIDDGLLNVVVLRPRGIAGWARVGSRLAAGGVLLRSRGGRLLLRLAPSLRALQYAQARRFQATFDGPQEVELDGDSVGRIIGVSLSVDRESLTFLIPQSTRPAKARERLQAAHIASDSRLGRSSCQLTCRAGGLATDVDAAAAAAWKSDVEAHNVRLRRASPIGVSPLAPGS